MSDIKEGSLHQFTAVAIDQQALLIEGAPGCGKTSLALMLIDRGATLIGDDGIVLKTNGNSLLASPPPATRGKLEIRNVGIVDLPSTTAPVALILSYDANAPRFVERTESQVIEGVPVPVLKFPLGNPIDAIRAEFALSLHGLEV